MVYLPSISVTAPKEVPSKVTVAPIKVSELILSVSVPEIDPV